MMILEVVDDVCYLKRRHNSDKPMKEKTLFVRDYMASKLICISADTDILQAVSQLLDHKISGAPVVDDKGNLSGILTERDCIQVAVNAGYFDDFGGIVSNFMSEQVETVSSCDNLMDIAEKFITSSFRRFPVLEDGKLVGLITRRDVLQALKLESLGKLRQ